MPRNETDDNIQDSSPEDLDIPVDGDDTGEETEQAPPPVESDENSETQSDQDATLLDSLKDAVGESAESDDETTSDEEAEEDQRPSESGEEPDSETAKTEPEGAEEVREEPRIPKARLDKVIRQRNELRPQAESWTNLRKAYEEAGVNDQAFEAIQEFGLMVARNDPSVKQRIEAMARAVGLRVEQDIPAELKQYVDAGTLDEEAARQIAMQNQNQNQSASATAEMPKFSQGYTESHAQQDMDEVIEEYTESYGSLLNDTQVQKEIKQEFQKLINDAVELTGSKPALDKYGTLTRRAVQAVIEPRTRVQRPTEKPLRPSTKPSGSTKGISSAEEYVAKMLKDI